MKLKGIFYIPDIPKIFSLKDITTIRITKDSHVELLKIMGQIQARTGKIPTLDDALKELLENYKKKTKN